MGETIPDYLLDTGVLLRHIRNRPGFLQLLLQLNDEGDLYISVFTRIEVLRGMRSHERERTMRLLDTLISYPLSLQTANRTGNLLRLFLDQGRTLSIPDAVIGVSALELGATLVTLNARHFPIPDLLVLAVDEEARPLPPNS